MTDALTVLVADPEARVVESPTGTWIVSGLDTGGLAALDRIDGVGQGEWHEWNLATDERTVERIDSLSPAGRTAPDRAPVAIEDAVDDVLARADVDDAFNLYSGGVDSTLTQTFVDPDAEMLNVGIDAAEYRFEMEYAREGAAHFDGAFEQAVLSEADLLEHLEASVAATGSPSCPFQIVLLNEAFARREGRPYLMAVGADSIFGNTGTKGARVADWLSPLVGSPLAGPAAAAAPDPVGSYLGWLAELDGQLGRKPASPGSYAQQYSTYTNPELVASLFDEGLVADRCRRQVAYARDRIELDETAGRFGRQAALRHALLVFGHRVGARWRQLAFAHGNSLIAPFETRRLLECAASVPADERFVQGIAGLRDLSTKYLLKRTLENRLPAYDTGREKGAGVLPFERYVDSGPLADVFETYDPPAFATAERCRAVLDDGGRQGWNLVTYAIWRDRVLDNPDLTVVPSTERLEWTTPTADGPTTSVER
ncbi:MAG: asparagine synthase-related protein [Haloarculaceae archaeon]